MGWRFSLVMPILWAMAMTLSSPTLVARRTNAQLIEPAVARPEVVVAAAGLVVHRLILRSRAREHGLEPSTVSLGE